MRQSRCWPVRTGSVSDPICCRTDLQKQLLCHRPRGAASRETGRQQRLNVRGRRRNLRFSGTGKPARQPGCRWRPAARCRQLWPAAGKLGARVCRRVWTRFNASVGICKRKKKREDASSHFSCLLVSYRPLAHEIRPEQAFAHIAAIRHA